MTHGGMGYAQEYHVERYLRESLIPRIAPVSPQLILSYLAERVLDLPKSVPSVLQLIRILSSPALRAGIVEIGARRAPAPIAPTTSSPTLMTIPPPSRIRCGNWVNRLAKPGAVFDRSNSALVSALERGCRVRLVEGAVERVAAGAIAAQHRLTHAIGIDQHGGFDVALLRAARDRLRDRLAGKCRRDAMGRHHLGVGAEGKQHGKRQQRCKSGHRVGSWLMAIISSLRSSDVNARAQRTAPGAAAVDVQAGNRAGRVAHDARIEPGAEQRHRRDHADEVALDRFDLPDLCPEQRPSDARVSCRIRVRRWSRSLRLPHCVAARQVGWQLGATGDAMQCLAARRHRAPPPAHRPMTSRIVKSAEPRLVARPPSAVGIVVNVTPCVLAVTQPPA